MTKKKPPTKPSTKPFISVWQWLKASATSLIRQPAFYIYLIAVLINLPWFLPNLGDIAPWDETYYIVNGKEFFSGQLPFLADGPLYNFIAGFITLFFKSSPFWLIHVNSVMRFLLFTLLFVGTWQVGRAFKDEYNPIILFGFLVISPVLTQNFEYPADLLFAALSAIAFGQMVTFIKTKRIKHVWWTSFWLGLGMLTRGDAMILIIALAIFVLWFGAKHHRWWRLLLAVLVPFLSLSVGYVLLRGAITGDFETGMASRSYMAFEQGQEVDMPEGEGRFAAPTESYYVARELFGTPEENDYSVFRAISRNPQAYLSRVINVIKSLPGLFMTAFYRRDAIFLALLALRGWVALVQKKKTRPIAILGLVWMLPLSAGIARTLVRVGYFRVFYFVIFVFAIFGLKALLDSLRKTREGLVWAILMGSVMILALVKGEEAVQIGMLVYLSWLLLVYLLSKRSKKYPQWQYMAMLLLLVSGYFLRTGVIVFTPRQLGQEPGEQAALILREVTEPGDSVLTCTPSVVFLADREVANFCGADIPEFESSEAFIEWVRAQGFEAIYFDSAAPDVLRDLSLDQRDKALRQAFGTYDGDAYIFLVEPAD